MRLILALILTLVVLAMVFLAAGFLLIPLSVSLQGSKTGASTTGEFSVHWLGIRLLRQKFPEAPSKTRRVPAGRRRVDAAKMVRLLAESYPSLLILVRAFRKAVSFRSFSAFVNFGLGDPAETAVMCGYIWAVLWLLDYEPRISIAIKPDLMSTRFDGSVAAEAGVRLLPLVLAFLRAYRKRSFRALIGEARRSG